MKEKERQLARLATRIAANRTDEPYMSSAQHDEQARRYLEARADVVIYLFQGSYYGAPESSPGFVLLKSGTLSAGEAFCESRRLAFSHAATCNPFARCQ